MNIAYLANIRFPSDRAHAAQIAHMCHAFEQTGSAVTLFVNSKDSLLARDAFQYYGLTNSVSVVHVKSLPLFSPMRISFYFREISYAYNFLTSGYHDKYDILYCRNEWIVLLLRFFVPKEKLVWESHEAKFNFPARNILRKGIKVVAISEGIRSSYEKRKINPEQILVADDGIDESFFESVESKEQARKRLELNQNENIVMYIGGLDRWKGITTFCGAAEHTQGISFVVIGGSVEQVENLKKMYPNVVFLGSKPYRELKDNQQAADILVVPNTAATELSAKFTSPLKLFAHMASGVPLIISDIPSLTSVLNTDLVGVFEPENSQSLANEIENVLNSLEQRNNNAAILKEDSRMFTWKNRAAKINSFISN